MLDPINDDQTNLYLQVRKKHLLIGVISVFGLFICVVLYLFSLGLYVGFSPPPNQSEPVSSELIVRFEQLQNQINDAVIQFNELSVLKDKLELQNLPKQKPIPKSSKDLGKGGSEPHVSLLNFKDSSYDVQTSFESMQAILDIFENNIPLIKGSMTLAIYKNTNLPSGVPILGEYIFSSGFGIRPDPFTLKDEFHTGLDFAALRGTYVVASEPGAVIKVVTNSDRTGLGNYVEMSHQNGTTSKYGHLDKILVSQNQKLNRGEILGTVGNTGRSTGPHLHFEVSIGGTQVDPLSGASALKVKPSPIAMAAVNAEAKSRCAELLLIVVDENAALMKECLLSGGKKAKDLLISRFQEGRMKAIKDKNALSDDCTYVDKDHKLQSSTREECRSLVNN
ncbi:M23 family metallopeptidase [Polynucleobacter kasalickyi]|uniref:Murein DD-endopeptidase MepM and murein hydrolase activator NlpD, contain LysM domain n=1 Tax=Polynucleobacter kasalickyi TaxID=1938817 RepID=A0A1W2BRB9_9BURK|nr:M23 family metallopeptidase [Polynucleobacter kasalickyi]SMC75545.1 Murein DD-endopeptidase MepM and murein hydrolase activator NlpD, contain LysM domain [Polynucleobacter kasalickyi]